MARPACRAGRSGPGRQRPQRRQDDVGALLAHLAGRAAVVVGDRALAGRAAAALRPAAGELAGAGSGLLTAGPVDATLALPGG